MSKLISALTRAVEALRHPGAEPKPELPEETEAPAQTTIHPGLSDEELVVLLTVAASEALDAQVRIETFRAHPPKNLSWVAQGRADLQTHRLR
ncbi:hypothetical protein [Geomesophilobacter sediminis]|uniref:Uncharacterized protein n=1 Tax=Geomesophilobacter sediminis TaxID=2798584 RepID=A0A8J7J002_9BACT|nr:hypothetical protein [Geomesophilobacter sediminis]MBJ6725777.1 hypothetical protein [Geomesophilobacter sediminis]